MYDGGETGFNNYNLELATNKSGYIEDYCPQGYMLIEKQYTEAQRLNRSPMMEILFVKEVGF